MRFKVVGDMLYDFVATGRATRDEDDPNEGWMEISSLEELLALGEVRITRDWYDENLPVIGWYVRYPNG